MYLPLAVRVGFLTEVALCPPLCAEFWEGWLCLDVPSVATAVWCFGAPSHHDSELSNKAQCLLLTL